MSDTDLAVEAALKRFEAHYPAKIELSLGRILDALDALGRPQDRLPPVIHVAGTNGKGSTCAYLRAMAEAAGLRVHVFTSPHLVRFNERIRLAGKLIDDNALVALLNRAYELLGGLPLSRFEVTTAAALLAFSETEADLLILEVGLGGRFDATNVIGRPALSVITPVDFDHKQFLGTDLAGIAGEKAGVIKQNRPVISAIQTRVCADVIAAKAKELNAPLHKLTLEDRKLVPEDVALLGEHQRLNAALAAKALSVLDAHKISTDAMRAGAVSALWPGRMQKLSQGPVTDLVPGCEVWLDGGHNPHAARAIANVLKDMGGKTVLISAMLASKDHSQFFWAFEDVAKAVITLPNAEGHASADPKALAETARAFIPMVESVEDLEPALAATQKHNPDRVLICGSLYLAGDVLLKNREVPT